MLVLKTIQEVEELKDICCSKGEGTQELRVDDFSRHDLRGKPVHNKSAYGSNSGTAR